MLLLLLIVPVATAIIITAPEACGGSRVVRHSTAFFGPTADESAVANSNVPLFPPRAQRDGVYLRLVSRVGRQHVHTLRSAAKSLFLGMLFARAPDGELPSDLPPQIPLIDAPSVTIPAQNTPDAWKSDPQAPVPTAGPTQAPVPSSHPHHSHHPHHTHHSVPSYELVASTSHERPLAYARLSPSVEPSAFALFDSCFQLSVPADQHAVKGTIAVVARGVCDFAQKIHFMQDAGALGVIVVNFKDEGDHLANMKLNTTKKNPEISIPAVMIRYRDWARIAPCWNETKVIFTSEGEAQGDYGHDALNWAMMRGMALWILCQCGVNVVRYKRRVSEYRARADAIAALPVETYHRTANHDHSFAQDETTSLLTDTSQVDTSTIPPATNKAVTSPAPSSSVMDHHAERFSLVHSESQAGSSSAPPPISAPSSASTAPHDEAGSDDEEPICAVCLEEFESGQQVRQLACSHLYHRTCIDPWLQASSNSCPLCKREIPNLPPPPTQLHYGSMLIS
ncbi:unnamed protein product [Agarophyton chilense]|eukprot:gb/GEZJ01003804.1/.p1 GENE.gb/GEZJ01003804.1/~~gb/GEZJ01003804.1/.p1  ORF type:complete len:521 (-),score=64.04 gb/GEZJ01003804.1/:1348-2874(-)